MVGHCLRTIRRSMFDPLELLKQSIKKAAAVQPNSALSCLVGEITAVDDPANQGRCKVKLKNFSAQDGSVAYATDWSETLTTRISKGTLPKNLIGKSVLIFPILQSYETVVINISNSLLYTSSDELPVACKENLGVEIIRLSGQEAFKCTCLLRNGQYKWIDTCDLKHGHASGDRQDQDNDTGGNLQVPIEQTVIHDSVFSTATTSYEKESGFTPPILT